MRCLPFICRTGLIVAVFFLSGLIVYAAPTSIIYQGSLKQNGTPVNGTFSMTFTITNAAGVAQGTPITQSVPVVEGLYRVELPFADVPWATIDPYIKTQIAGTALSPIEKLSATPYALVSKELLGGATLYGSNQVGGRSSVIDGAIAAPSYSFQSDPDTGFARTRPNYLSVVTGGTEAIAIDNNDVSVMGRKLNVIDGTKAAPGLAFYNDTDTGFTRGGANSLSVVTGGTEAIGMDTSDVSIPGRKLNIADGDATAPGLRFYGDPNTGFYRNPALPETIGVTTNGEPLAEFGKGGRGDDIPFTMMRLFGGGPTPGRGSMAFDSYTTAGVTTVAKRIANPSTDSELLIIWGSDSVNSFADVVMWTSNTQYPPVTITSKANTGTPAVRTYSSPTNGTLFLRMGSGTYAIHAVGIGCSYR